VEACGGGGGGGSSAPVAPPAISGFSPSAEFAGNVVSVTGSGFSGVTSVTVGGVPSTAFAATSSTALAITLPTNAVTGSIVVTTGAGSATSPSALTIVSVPGVVANKGYRLMWHDEFDGNAFDPNKWVTLLGERHNATNSADAISVANSVLTLRTYTDPTSGKHFTGFLQTNRKYEFTFGYIEARMRFINSPGQWSAFWLNSNGNIPRTPLNPNLGAEIDIIEHRHSSNGNRTNLTNQYVGNVHWNGYTSAVQSASSGLIDLPAGEVFSDWHTVSLLWTPQGYQMMVDGKVMWTTDQGLSLSPEYILFSNEVLDQGWAGNIPVGGYGASGSSVNPVLQVDWVRVWQVPA
jgi:beta-glucanase (GH16 family)